MSDTSSNKERRFQYIFDPHVVHIRPYVFMSNDYELQTLHEAKSYSTNYRTTYVPSTLIPGSPTSTSSVQEDEPWYQRNNYS
jgi:hypothetical protein